MANGAELRLAEPGPEDGDRLDAIVDAVETVFHGHREVVRLATAALLAHGHILFEDVPGVGKTTLARAVAAATGLEFRRIQFTSDLLPSDVLGVSIFNPETRRFETRPGPVFANIVLADEINRAPPRTQSGLLEAMQEGAVTIDDRTYQLPRPFIVLATQNPLEHHGTYPLPESQLDRFLMRLTIGYPDEAWERRILEESASPVDPLENVKAVLEPDQVLALQARVGQVRADPDLVEYAVAIVRATRDDGRVRLGVSPRGAIALLRAARAYALVDGRTFLAPDDVRRLVEPCLAHRIVPVGGTAGEAYEEVRVILDDILDAVPAPV